jgi:hypothetical protein
MHSILGADQSFPIYCDPSRKLYTKLGMMSNLGTGEKAPGYVKKGALQNVVDSVKTGIASGTSALQGGHPAQNGGEMLFAKYVHPTNYKFCYLVSLLTTFFFTLVVSWFGSNG